MRDIGQVLNQIRLLASDNEAFTKDLDWLENKLLYTPPEMMVNRWHDFGYVINKHVGSPPRNNTEWKMASLFTTIPEAALRKQYAEVNQDGI